LFRCLVQFLLLLLLLLLPKKLVDELVKVEFSPASSRGVGFVAIDPAFVSSTTLSPLFPRSSFGLGTV
jgi:hypothetical protein